MSEYLTRVEILFLPEFENNWIRFGEPRHRCDLDRRRAYVYFAAGALFCYIRWRAGDYGTRDWRMYLLQTARPGERMLRIPGIAPGAHVLGIFKGKLKIEKTFELIDSLETSGFNLPSVSPDYYRKSATRILTRLPVPAYSPDQHRAYQLSCDLTP